MFGAVGTLEFTSLQGAPVTTCVLSLPADWKIHSLTKRIPPYHFLTLEDIGLVSYLPLPTCWLLPVFPCFEPNAIRFLSASRFQWASFWPYPTAGCWVTTAFVLWLPGHVLLHSQLLIATSMPPWRAIYYSIPISMWIPMGYSLTLADLSPVRYLPFPTSWLLELWRCFETYTIGFLSVSGFQWATSWPYPTAGCWVTSTCLLWLPR